MKRYLGKALFIKERDTQAQTVLVLGDVHLGVADMGAHAASALVSEVLERTLYSDLEQLFSKTGDVDTIVLLGDLKQEFSPLSKGVRHGLVNLFEYLEKKCERIVVIKGNHDTYVENVASGREIDVVTHWVWKGYCFIHGDRDITILHTKEVTTWIMGHMHPALTLREGSKQERFKCFLEGRYYGKNIIILPSFIEYGFGADITGERKNLAWDFDLRTFTVWVVGENLEVLSFGKVKNYL